jgi:leucyl-tRNA synthetase
MYNHNEIESKWVQKWADTNLYATPTLKEGDKKKYMLIAFPYPSADGLHVGHPLSFTGADILARYYRATGHKVLYPMGWDSFGLPTENFAKKKGLHPQLVTDSSIKTFRQQVNMLGASFGWDREVNTSDPSYYKWTQWLFQLLYKKGLAYKKEALVNWDPVDKTVLANEQVLADGTAERSGALVEQKMMSQWFFKITDYAERLITDLDGLDWPQSTKLMQKNWVGKSVGVEMQFPIDNDTTFGSKNIKGIKTYKSYGILFDKSERGFDSSYNEGSKELFRKGVVELINSGDDITTNLVKDETNYLFLHGWCGSSETNCLPEIAENFSQNNVQFQIPNLPNTQNPNIDEQADFVLKTCKINSKTVIVGHSLGVAVGLKVLEKLDFEIAKFVSIAGFVSGGFHPEHISAGVTDPFEISSQNFDFGKIKQNAFVGLWSDDDHYITAKQTQELETKLGFEVQKTTGYKHLNNLSEKITMDLIVDNIKIFTTRIDTVFGVSYLVLAPEHSLVNSLTTDSNRELVANYILETKKKSQLQRTDLNKDKSGVFTGSYAINPLTDERIPIWVADYVLGSYGTGAVMAVPSHDERDLEFANKYDLPKKVVIEPKVIEDYKNFVQPDCFTQKGILINSGIMNGLSSEMAIERIAKALEIAEIGKKVTTYKLRDWSVGRQRYWGCPIPIIYDKNGNAELVPENELPVLLPQDLEITEGLVKPLAHNQNFINSCKEGYTREADTMDTFVCSSWYFFRYMSGNIDNAFANSEDMKKWGPVDEYIIGAEHTVMHLLFARFFTKVLYDEGLIDFKEPFTKMKHQGMILGNDHQKMSKSKGNVINPNEIYEEYGADTLRVYEMFMGPFDQPKPWSTSSIKGVRRFLDRVWKMQDFVIKENSPLEGCQLQVGGVVSQKIPITKKSDEKSGGYKKLEEAVNKLIKKVGEDILGYSFNTSVAEFMKFVNLVDEIGSISNDQFQRFLLCLSPFAPFITEEIWQNLKNNSKNISLQENKAGQNIPLQGGAVGGGTYSIHTQPFPTYKKVELQSITIGVQINGKVRGDIEISPTASEQEAQELVLKLDFVKKWIGDLQIKKFIYKQGKIINIVIS